MRYECRYAVEKDINLLARYDKHITPSELRNSVKSNRIIVMHDGDRFIGLLRYNLFWDNIPFMNMLYITDGERGNGCGSKLVDCWENNMKELGYDKVMTSTQSDERGQFFYRKHGYKDCGVLLLPDETAEIIFYKSLK